MLTSSVLYDKNHYKLALGQINTARHLIEQVAKDYVRLIKFGDSLYRCKQLKRAALGRMATIMRRNKDPLAYLEQVRQHISRLPSIDPSTRTLVICGYPNVGKSSFINKVTRADVDVQPYAFTTKSLFVGHMDYKYLRWQVIDTPGILDHPLEEMNTIEMQAITALAHLRAAVLYFMDLSEQCGYTIEAQVQLFNSIKPLFANKPTFLVINKIDVAKLEDLDDERAGLVRSLVDESDGSVQIAEISTFTDEGIMDLKQTACETLLATRVEGKVKGPKANSILNRLHVATPQRRDDVERKPFVPESIASGTRKKFDLHDPLRRRTEKDIQEEQGGAGVHNIDMKKNYMLANDDWKYDTIPEIYEGKNIADFIDPDILTSLDKLEREEEKLEADGFYDESEEELNSEDEELRAVAEGIKQRKDKAKLLAQTKKALQNRPHVPRKLQHRTLSQMAENMRAAGIDPSNIEMRAELLAKGKGLVGKRKSRDEDDDVDMEDEEDEEDADMSDGMSVEETAEAPSRKKIRGAADKRSVALTRGRSSTTASTNREGGPISARAGAARIPARNRQADGLRNVEQLKKARSLHELGIRERNQHAKAGESDRRIQESKPKWLFAGTYSIGFRSRYTNSKQESAVMDQRVVGKWAANLYPLRLYLL